MKIINKAKVEYFYTICNTSFVENISDEVCVIKKNMPAISLHLRTSCCCTYIGECVEYRIKIINQTNLTQHINLNFKYNWCIENNCINNKQFILGANESKIICYCVRIKCDKCFQCTNLLNYAVATLNNSRKKYYSNTTTTWIAKRY